jgi:hypothetical protein
MTIQEAIKSKKPFKRKVWSTWFRCIKSHSPWLTDIEDKNSEVIIGIGDILADDWEVKP